MNPTKQQIEDAAEELYRMMHDTTKHSFEFKDGITDCLTRIFSQPEPKAQECKTAEEWHHTKQYVEAQRAANPNWKCHCVTCEHVQQIISSSHLSGRLEQAREDVKICDDISKTLQSQEKSEAYGARICFNQLESLIAELERKQKGGV